MVASLLEEGADERRQDAANETQQEFCFGLPGAIAPAGEFDPAGLLRDRSKAEVYRWRESELTHGRVAMLASAGFLVRAPCSNPSPSPSPSPSPNLTLTRTLSLTLVNRSAFATELLVDDPSLHLVLSEAGQP